MAIYVGTGNADSIDGSADADTINGNGGADTLNGLAGNDSINGGAGADFLNGGTGSDTLNGGADGDTFYVDSNGDVIVEAAGDTGTDAVGTSVSYGLTAGAAVEVLGYALPTTLAPTPAVTGVSADTTSINLTGNEFAQTIYGTAGANVLDGGRNSNPGVSDTLEGGLGDDTYIVRNIADVITDTGGIDTVFVSAADLSAQGEAVATFTLTSAGIETISAVSQRGTEALSLTGFTDAQQVVGNFGSNTLNGGGGTDTLIGLDGDDTYVIRSGTETIALETGGSDTLTFGAGAPATYNLGAIAANADVSIENIRLVTGGTTTNVTGNTVSQTITGTAAAETLNGGAGDDTLVGGAGVDTYVVDVSRDVITEAATGANASAGEFVYIAAASGAGYDLAEGVGIENLVAGFAGTGATQFADAIATTTNVYAVGNSLSQTIYGNAGANVLDGDRGTGANADTLAGGAGDDIYRVYDATDVVDERIYTAAGTPTAGSDAGGVDLVYTSASYTLAASTALGSIENLSVADQGGTTAGITLTGNDLANRITGNNAANTISGGTGADTLIGLGGSDTYTVDNVGDVVTEAVGGGTLDTINFAAVAGFTTYALAAGSEVDAINLGGNVVNVTGNEFAQTITGTAVAETITGGGGADLLIGGGGIDTYNVSDSAAVIVDNDGLANVVNYTSTTGGIDISDGQSITAITATAATGDVYLVGNNLVQTLTGNAGNNILNGQGGSNGALGDTLVGGAGDDIYRVYTTNISGSTITLTNGDVITETAGNGNDTVYTSVNYALGNNVENLVAADQANVTTLTLVGNALNNQVSGSNGNNVLVGGAGIDTLTGLGGADTFHFNQTPGTADADVIADFNVGQGDRISLDAAVFTGLGATFDTAELQSGTQATGTAAVVLYDQATGRLFYDTDGAGAGVATLFATVSAGTALTAAQFTITPANTLPTP